MKKWLLGLLVLLLAAIAASYVFIPGVIRFSKIEKVPANSEEVFIHFADSVLRQKWMNKTPGETFGKNDGNLFVFKNDSFEILNIHAPAFNVLIGNDATKLNSQVLMVPEGVDSTIIIWESEITAGSNPISRIGNYLKASKIKSRFSEILESYHSYVSVPANVYSFPIETTKVKDTILITQRKLFRSSPTIAEVYSMVEKLEGYAKTNGAELTNAPMLNITVLDSTQIQCTVAIPIDKVIAKEGDMYISKMVPGKILVETVKGGPATIKYAYQRLLDYFRQHKHISPALSFESMVTNRVKEADTSKWVTKIYYPIF
ncbi:MAG: GyrI-like domain-containing protein [Bacteroidota bacterium]